MSKPDFRTPLNAAVQTTTGLRAETSNLAGTVAALGAAAVPLLTRIARRFPGIIAAAALATGGSFGAASESVAKKPAAEVVAKRGIGPAKTYNPGGPTFS